MQKVKVALEHATKTQAGGRDILLALPVHNLGAGKGNNLKLL
jgi:hypothetical protein